MKKEMLSRRGLIGAAATTGLAATSVQAGEKQSATVFPPLQTRKLGRNGPEVSILAVGGQAEATSVDYYNQIWDQGIRYFDVAESYRGGKSERALGEWIRKYPERRKEVFIVTKDRPKQLSQIPGMLDKRLDVLGTDYLDLFLIHGLGAKDYGEESYLWPKSPEFKAIGDKLKKRGKINLMGFSCHDLQSDRHLHAAAEGGFVDAILMHSSPFHQEGDGMDRAIEACNKAGIGLVGMKVMRNAARVPKRIPEFDELGITTHQAALHALWSDERFSAGVIWMANEEQMKENAEGARKYKKPLLSMHRKRLQEVMLANGPALCPGCQACKAVADQYGSDLKSISRYVAYYEQDGSMDAADLYRALSARERNTGDIDLAKLHHQCAYHVNYPEIVKRAAYYFG